MLKDKTKKFWISLEKEPVWYFMQSVSKINDNLHKDSTTYKNM